MNTLAFFKDIEAIVFDVDGVFTNSQMLITEKGEMLRSMSTRDGWAVKQLVRSGIHVVVITGGSSEGVALRLKGLGIEHIYYGIGKKLPVLIDHLKTHSIPPSKTIYMGDDIPDLTCMQHVAYSACPSDAAPEIQQVCTYISPFAGGHGCVRDVVEKLMKIQGKWPV
jgi:3-deoxy-D-manno-octulosonate 8-phosphate phosphatase (KDO 8-P phosphatase)